MIQSNDKIIIGLNIHLVPNFFVFIPFGPHFHYVQLGPHFRQILVNLVLFTYDV